MNRHLIEVLLFTLAVTAASGRAAAQSLASHPPGDPRIRSLLFVPNQVVRLHGWVGYHIDLEFESGESFVTMGGGDLAGLTFGAVANHLVLKPKAATVATNLTVITNRRTYVIDYSASGGRPDPLTDELVYSLRFNYPPPVLGPAAAERITEDLAKSPAARYQNLNYWYCGNPLLQPIGVSDDGVHTRFRFGPAAEIPAIFVKNDDGAESLLNFSVEGSDLIIHRLARQFVLRRGTVTGCITNKGFIGSGERLDSGTVSPQVHRSTRQVAP